MMFLGQSRLPKVKTDETKILVLVEVVIIHKLRVGNLLGLPNAWQSGSKLAAYTNALITLH